jgi:hypothetical protein
MTPIQEEELPQAPDNDDITGEPLQTDVLAGAQIVLGNPEAKVGDLGEIRALFQKWIADSQDGVLVEARTVLLNPDADVRELGEARTLFQKWILEVQGRQTSTKPAPLDSEGTTDLSPEQLIFMGTLKARYKRNQHRIACHNNSDWAKIETKLRINPAKLEALKQMEASGGFPDVYKIEGDDFIFGDLSRKAPTGRKGLNYHQAVARAEGMGAGTKLMTPDDYKMIKKELNIIMDERPQSVWLDASEQIAMIGENGSTIGAGGEVFLPLSGAKGIDRNRSFRCALKV